jgi:replicative DNA helicase
LREPEKVMSGLAERGVDRLWFYEVRQQLVWWAFEDMARRGVAIDELTTRQWLLDSGKLKEIEDPLAFMLELQEATPSAANWPVYADILEQKYRQRQMLRIAGEAVSRIYAEQPDTKLILSEAERAILKLSEDASSSAERPVPFYLPGVMRDVRNYHRGHAQIQGLTTGLEYLDKVLCGFGGKHGNYVVLSSRPGLGKTSLATDIALHVAFDHVWWEPVLYPDGKPQLNADGDALHERRVGHPVCIFSLEMKAEALVERMLWQRSGVNIQNWRTGFASKADLAKMEQVEALLLEKGSNILIDDESRCTIETVKAKARRLHRSAGVKLFILDYIQLLRSGRERSKPDRVQELTEISGELQSLGKELGVPFLVLAQMNRDYEKDALRTPRLADLKDCGAIEQDADVVMFLYEPKLTKERREKLEQTIEEATGDANWSTRYAQINGLVAKARYGPSGKVVQLLFETACTHYHDWNVWLKQRGVKAAAAGERGYAAAPEEEA